MNIPQNFEKIDKKRFLIDNGEFAINKSDDIYGTLWVFHKKGDNYIWPLFFEIDWKNEKLSIKECPPGEGMQGEYIQTDIPLMKHLVKDMDSFIYHIRDIVNTLIKKQKHINYGNLRRR